MVGKVFWVRKLKKDIKINLFALTGFGNAVLKALLAFDVKILKVYTRKEKGEFPYYKVENLSMLCKKRGISVKFISANRNWSIENNADINLAATFHRILSARHLRRAKVNINIHPSLLPSYKGPTPTNWMVHNKSKVCGITAHYLNANIDAGAIIYQKKYKLKSKTDNRLRKFLADKSVYAVMYIIKHYPNYYSIKSRYKESYYPSYYKEIKQK
ncbi:MAG: formyltransferase family protein [Candidatus Omnitrophota bacterium]|nr:formyltransferase family protein [Candidatus Omnitrophota bacterium]